MASRTEPEPYTLTLGLDAGTLNQTLLFSSTRLFYVTLLFLSLLAFIHSSENQFDFLLLKLPGNPTTLQEKHQQILCALKLFELLAKVQSLFFHKSWLLYYDSYSIVIRFFH